MQPFLETKAVVDELEGGDGSAFEEFMNALVGMEASTHGIHAKDIQFDYRTNVGDHGIDLEITKAHGQANPRFIPAVKSIWSFKAGEAGIDLAKFEKEVTAGNHQPLRDRLSAGYVFVWCALQPVNTEKRDQFVKKAAELAAKYGWKPNQFEFRWVNAIHGLAESYPNLLAHHVPKAWSVVGSVTSIDKWVPQGTDRAGYGAKWVPIAGRDGLAEAIQGHLRSSEGYGVLHIAGLSGVGKTRLVHHACMAIDLVDTFYLPHCDLLTDKLVDILRERAGHVRLVIDEVKLQHVNDLFDKLGPHGKHLRVVTIGPATRRDSRGSGNNVMYLAEPDSGTDTIAVIKSFSPSLSNDVVHFIAGKSRHDLRFALLLAKALRKDDAIPRKPGEIWNRVMELFKGEPHHAELEGQYGFLSTSIDINCDDEELRSVANCYGTSVDALRSAMKAAENVGLGITTPSYFEACPRGLAAFMFEEHALHLLAPKIAEFFKTCPDRLKRRIVERCHEVEDDVKREEVVERIAAYFRAELGKPLLANIADRETSRLFQRWAELDPDRGLAWLNKAVEAASNEDLAKFDGHPDGSGGWRGRRQIVWLLEHLSCFDEYFSRCEAALFRLAQVETEESISNNSRNIWLRMFSPPPIPVETPYPVRWDLLKNRLTNATLETLPLLLKAVERSLASPPGFWMAPPPVVGGRIVPQFWLPKSRRELRELQERYAAELLNLLEQLANTHGEEVRGYLVKHAYTFAEFGLLHEYRSTLARIGLDEELKRELRKNLDHLYELESFRRKDDRWKQILNDIAAWLEEEQPKVLVDRVKDLTGKDFWSTGRMVNKRNAEEVAVPYKQLADEILRSPTVLEGLTSWFSGEECRSGMNLGDQLGRQDKKVALFDLMLAWMAAGIAQPLILGYFMRVELSGEQRGKLTQALDTLTLTRPADAFVVTAHVDTGATGVQRVLRLTQHLEVIRLRLFGTLAYEPWKELLSSAQKVEVLEALHKHADNGARDVLRVAMQLEWLWSSPGKANQTLDFVPHVLRTLRVEAEGEPFEDAHEWDDLAKFAATSHPGEVAELAVHYITAMQPRAFERSDMARKLLVEIADTNPREVSTAVFNALKDPKRELVFHVFEFRNLFDAIDLEVLKPMIEAAGESVVAAIARHVKSPYVEGDQPVVPDLTNWLLTKYGGNEKVVNSFLIGRHSGEWRSGHARDRASAQLAMLKRFEDRPEPWIKRWLQYERDEIKREIKMDDKFEERAERE